MIFDPLGDGVSAVQYIDHMGDDLRVVNAARVSLDRESQFECDETGRWLLEQDAQLIASLAERNHLSPFFHPQICLRISMPWSLGEVWWRSTAGVSRSEVFQRYVKSKPRLYSPVRCHHGGESASISASSGEQGAAAGGFAQRVETFYRDAESLYEDALGSAFPSDMAPRVLPQSMYTSWIETGSLYYFSRMFKLHGRQGCQDALRAYAACLNQIAIDLFPVSWHALAELKGAG
jgi:thymidylate synthase (FAD)